MSVIDSKITWDGGEESYTFSVDYYNPELIRENVSDRSTDGTLQMYEIYEKWEFELGFQNITPTIQTNLLTIYNLKTALEFYPDASGATHYTVYWANGWTFAAPLNNNLPKFGASYFNGTIILKEA